MFRLLATTHEHEDDYDDDQEKPKKEQEAHDPADQPHRNPRLLTAFSLRLLTALDQPVDFGVLRKQPLYFFEFRDRRRVLVGPVIVETFLVGGVGWTVPVISAGGLHVLHYRVRRHDEREA